MAKRVANEVLLPNQLTLLPPRKPLSPPLKWVGGKRWLVPLLFRLYAPFRHLRFAEPFVGGMSVSLGLSPSQALLADINVHLINFYHHLQSGLQIGIALKNEAETYYRYRDRFNQLVRSNQADSKEAAELFYYLNRTGFNGLCRFNNKGEFNVPFGRYKKINYVRDFTPYAAVVSRYTILASDFRNFPLEDSDFVYADPPYDVEFTEYSAGGFSFEDQEELAVRLAKHSGPVLISNQATRRILDLYSDLGFELVYLLAPRRISSNGDRTPATEVLAAKDIDSQMLHRSLSSFKYAVSDSKPIT